MEEGEVRLLIVDDEEIIQEVLGNLLAGAGYATRGARTAAEGLEKVREGSFNVILLDLMLPDRGGLDVLRALKKQDPDTPVILITAYGSIETAVQAMRLGAYDYITKPFKNDEVLMVIRNAARQKRLQEENRKLRKALNEQDHFHHIVGKSKGMQEVFQLVQQVASSRSTVLVQGESGTGKELVAKAIHKAGNRSERPFVVVHSGSMPPDLLESNLFGHVRGAFTGAVSTKKGLFEVAEDGSIFFDEISTVLPEVQAKLLRVIQEKEFLPLGSVETLKVDVRILAATNVDLQEMVLRGEFREDLFYRLNVINIQLPSLRERTEDIPLLVEHFLEKYALENGKSPLRITSRALDLLLTHSWPGNIRELQNVIERAAVLARTDILDEGLLPPQLRSGGGGLVAVPGKVSEAIGLNEAMDQYEAELILMTLKRARGVQRKAAELLGVKPSTLNEKIKRLGLRE